MPTNKELLFAAQNEQLQAVAKNRVAVLTGLAELEEFGGEDNYVASVSAIVNAYPEGIMLTKLREVLPNYVVLEKAIKKLADDKEIDTEAVGKRGQLLKPLKKESAPPRSEVVSVDTNPTGNPAYEPKAPAPKKSTPKTVEIIEEDAQD